MKNHQEFQCNHSDFYSFLCNLQYGRCRYNDKLLNFIKQNKVSFKKDIKIDPNIQRKLLDAFPHHHRQFKLAQQLRQLNEQTPKKMIDNIEMIENAANGSISPHNIQFHTWGDEKDDEKSNDNENGDEPRDNRNDINAKNESNSNTNVNDNTTTTETVELKYNTNSWNDFTCDNSKKHILSNEEIRLYCDDWLTTVKCCAAYNTIASCVYSCI